MNKLIPYLKPYRRQSILSPLFKLFEACMDLTVPIVVARIIDLGIAKNDPTYIWHQIGILILLAILGISFSVTAQWFAASASVGFSSSLRQALFDHIQSLSNAEFDALGTDTLVVRMTNDINQVQNGLNLCLRLLLRSPFIVFGAMILAFTINVQLALVFVVVIPILCLIVFTIMLKSIPLYQRVQQALDRLLGLTQENLVGTRVIRAFRKEASQIQKFDDQNDALTRLNIKVGRLSALMNPATYVTINIATICLIWLGAIQVNGGVVTQGNVISLYNYMLQIVVELIKMATLMITLNKSLASVERIEQVFDVSSTLIHNVNDQTTSDAQVECRDVSFRYASSDVDVLSTLNFKIHKNETIGIIGATGSGKSTLAHLLTHAYDCSSGAIYIHGKNIQTYSQDEIVSMVGLVAQKAVLFEGTIRENLQFGNEGATDEQLWTALEASQADEIVKDKGGLDARIEQNGNNLSGGQKQRLSIARTLLKYPDVLILDDSASALDYLTEYRLRCALRGLENVTTIIISQRISSIMDADRILVLDDGKQVGWDTHANLLESCSVYQEIYDSQFENRGGSHA